MRRKNNRLWVAVGVLTIADLATLAILAFVYTAMGAPPLASIFASATPTITFTPTIPPPTSTPTASPTPLPTPTPVPAARIASGDRALFNGDWDKALKEFTSAQTAANGSNDKKLLAAALLGIGRTYYLTGEYSKALDALRAVVENYAGTTQGPAAFFFLGQTYTELDRYADAAEAYQNYLAHKPGVIDAYMYEKLGDALFAAGNYSGALANYGAALQSPRLDNGINVQIKLARVYAITGETATALVMYQDLYQRVSGDSLKARVDYLMAQTYLSIGENEKGIAAYQDAVQNFPTAYDSYLSLVELVNAGVPVDELTRGLVDYYAGEYQVAINAFDRYLAANPIEPGTANYYKGQALFHLSNYTGAIDQWNVVIANYKESQVWDNAWEQKAYIQWAYLDQYPEATQTLLDFVAKAPWHSRAAEFLYDAARVAERNGKLTKAAQIWERVAKEYPGTDYAFNSLFLAGISLYRQNDYAGALGIFQRLLDIATNITQKSNALFWIAKAQNAGGDKTAAQSTWGQAAAMDPTGYYSERARDILRGLEPFTPPKVFDLATDVAGERLEAEAWMRTTFKLPPSIDLSGTGTLAEDPRFQRGKELWDLGLYAQARDEFESLRLSVEDDAVNSYRLANYLGELGVYRSSIMAARRVLSLAGMDDAATMNAPAYFNHIRFGLYYSDLVVPSAQENDVSPLLIFSMIRQESFFEGFANSSAGARGLLQIIPSTGEHIAAQNGWPEDFTSDDLYRPVVSVYFGADYLRNQLNYLDGDVFAALAAYNGGPGNAKEWQSLSKGDPDLFLEIVRFDETRRYIRNIYEIFSIYRRLYDRTP